MAASKKTPTKKAPRAKVKGQKLSGHGRLKQALILRDALLAEQGFKLDTLTSQLRTVETNIGAQRALDDGKYLEAASSVCAGDTNQLTEWDLLIRTACGKVQFAPRYAQYLALLLFVHWWQMQKLDPQALLARLNDWLEKHPPEHENLTPFTEADLQFAAFWMATAAGKTHILHACLALLTEDAHHNWDRIILITPGDALSVQHAQKLRDLNQWDVFAYPQDGDLSAMGRLPPDTVIVLDINKLSEVKKGEGVSVPTSVFKDGRNLIFVDEGHKGQKSEQSLWKRLQQDLAGIDSPQSSHRGVLIEFSATFGQVAEQEHAFGRYAKSVLFDYAYDRFHADHYGKDFWHVKLDGRGDAEQAVQQHTLTAALLSYWHQLHTYQASDTQAQLVDKQLEVANPLWVLLGLSVIGGKNKSDQEQTSDVIDVLRFLATCLAEPAQLTQSISDILNIKAAGGDLLPLEVRDALRGRHAADIADNLLKIVFHWQPGDQPVFRLLKQANGELGLGLLRGDQVHYYGVVNVGDAAGLKNALAGATLTVDDDALSTSLFTQLSNNESSLNILIGSRRFAEGWDNYRASSLTLLRLGQGEGSLIIQMFGRVVRFAGVQRNGKRLPSPPPSLKPLQTAYVFGLRSSYLETFLNSLYSNGVMQTIEIECPTQINLPDQTPLRSLRSVNPEKSDFQVHLKGKGWLRGLNTVKLSLAASVATAGLSDKGLQGEKGILGEDLTEHFKTLLPLVDVFSLHREMTQLKQQMGLWNFRFEASAIEAALHSHKYEIFGLPTALQITRDADLLRLQRTAASLVRRLFESAYRKQEGRHSRFELIPAHHSGLPEKYRKEQH